MSVVSELGIKDKWGTNLGDYQVQYDVGLLDMVGHGLALIVTIIYATLVQPLGALSAGLLNQVASPQKYLSMLEKAYTWLLKPVFTLVSPLTLGLLVASLTLLVMFFRRSTIMSQPNGQLMQNALSSYFVIIFATWLLMNPFKLLRWAFEVLEGTINDITQGLTASSMDGSMTANYLTTVTQLINFGGVLNESSGGVWSQALRAGRDLKDVPQLADHISKVNPGSIFSALTAGASGVAMLAFSIVCFFLVAFYLFELAWRTAAVPFFMYYGAYNFRRMDLIWETLGRIASYFGMTAIVALCAIAGPVLATGIIAEIFGNKYAFLQIVTSVLVYALMTWLMVTFLKPTGRVAEMMRLQGKNQWRGYMQRSALLLANDKIQGASAKLMKLGDKAERALIKATTGITVPEGVPTSTTMMAGRMEKMSSLAGDTVSNELPRGKESEMKAIEAVPASARQTAFDAAESAKSVPAVGSSSKLSTLSKLAKALPGGKSKGLPTGEGAPSGGVPGSSPDGSGVATAALSAVAGALSGGSSSKEDDGEPEVIDGEVVSVDEVPDVGMGNSLNFPKAGDDEGVAQYQMQFMGSTGQFDEPGSASKSTGMDGSAMVGREPAPYAGPGTGTAMYDHDAPQRAEERMEAAMKPMFYAAEDEQSFTATGMVDPRVPLPSMLRAAVNMDPEREFADPEDVKDMALPDGVEVFGGKAVWTNPETTEMVELSGEVAAGTPDTVTRQAMLDHAAAIEDPYVREVFIVQHGLDKDAAEVASAEPAGTSDQDDTAQAIAQSGSQSAPRKDEQASAVVTAQAEPVHTVGEGFVEDDATVVQPASVAAAPMVAEPSAQSETSEISETFMQPQQAATTAGDEPVSAQPQPTSQTAEQPTADQQQPQQPTTEQQPTTAPTAQPTAAPALSARSVSEDTAKKMQREYAETTRADQQPQRDEQQPVAVVTESAPQPERKPAKPQDYKKDMEVLYRRESAGRAGTSVTATSGSGRGSVEIPRTTVASAPATPLVENLAASSVESVTAVTAREDVFEQSRLISSAMGTGGVTPVPDDDPSLNHTFVVVDGQNVVQPGNGLFAGLSW